VAIYNRFSDELTIIANCGEHKPEEFVAPMTLVQIKYSDGDDRYCFAEFLKANNGWLEIETALGNAPVVELDPASLKKAIRQAM